MCVLRLGHEHGQLTAAYKVGTRVADALHHALVALEGHSIKRCTGNFGRRHLVDGCIAPPVHDGGCRQREAEIVKDIAGVGALGVKVEEAVAEEVQCS